MKRFKSLKSYILMKFDQWLIRMIDKRDLASIFYSDLMVKYTNIMAENDQLESELIHAQMELIDKDGTIESLSDEIDILKRSAV